MNKLKGPANHSIMFNNIEKQDFYLDSSVLHLGLDPVGQLLGLSNQLVDLAGIVKALMPTTRRY